MKYVRFGTIALAALVLGAAPAQAQFVHFGLTGGMTFPTGDRANAQDKGYNGGVLVGFQAPLVPFGLRADVSMHHFPGKDTNVGGTTINASTNMWMTTANVTYGLPLPIKPYVIAGMGYYGSVTTVNGVPGSTNDKSFGINGGIGVQFTKLFMEARWHRINGDNNTTSTIMPVTVGFMF